MECIIEHLKAGMCITPLEALKLYGCFRLSGRIYDLKKIGYDIQKEILIDLKSSKRYASYFLVK
jgi:hypothetical protein